MLHLWPLSFNNALTPELTLSPPVLSKEEEAEALLAPEDMVAEEERLRSEREAEAAAEV